MIGGIWTVVPAFLVDGWSTQVGPDVNGERQPNKLEATINNANLAYDPSNVTSSLYGRIGRNTPVRLRLDAATTLLAAEASAWAPSREIAHTVSLSQGRATVALTAEGLQRRLGRWTDPLDSPIRRQTSSYTGLLGYWPFEDPSGAANLTNLVKGGPAGNILGTVTLAGDDGPGGSDKVLKLGSDGIVGSYFRPSTSSGYQLLFSAKLAALPTSATYENVLVWTDSLGRVWYWRANNIAWQIQVQDADGTVLSTSSVLFGAGVLPNEWNRLRTRVTVSGGTVTYEPAWYNQDFSSSYGTTNTFAGTATGTPDGWQATANPWTDGAAYGHLFATTDTTIDLINSFSVHAAFNGYLGETAGNRFARLMDEQNLNRYTDGDRNASAAMGRQKPGILLDLLTECAVTDAGLLYDEPTVQDGMTLRLSNFLINRPVALALTYGLDVQPPLMKVLDDTSVANDVTITNWDGTEISVEQASGTMSVQPPPSGVGRYKKSLSVSLANSYGPLQIRAEWERAAGTIDRPRYPSVTVDVTKFPAYAGAIANIRPGDVISIDGLEPDTVYLRVLTKTRAGGEENRDTVTFGCTPADLWLTGVYDNGVTRYDVNSSKLAGAESTTDTVIAVTMTDDESWSTTSLPYDVIVAGERMTVTGMTARTGTGPWAQTATVVRSVNGVVKTHSALEQMHIFNVGRYAL